MCLLPRDRLSHTSLTMGTRSRIGKQLADGSILSVYCHYDGYPEFNGRVLRDYFSTNDKVSDLIDGGDMSCTWTNAGWNNETLEENGPLHYTSRGESIVNNAPIIHDSMMDFLENGEEFGYVFANGEWTCYDTKTWSDTYKQQVAIPAGGITDGN